MKISKLRNIIRESIKKLMTEQANLPCTIFGCTDPLALNYYAGVPAHCNQGCIYTNNITGCGGSGSNGTCDSSVWSNYNNWLSTFSATIATGAANSNPNSPCNFLCQRYNQWVAQCPTVGPKWANMLSCKLEEIIDLSQTHGCNCS